MNEHGNQAYPEFLTRKPSYTLIMQDYQYDNKKQNDEEGKKQ